MYSMHLVLVLFLTFNRQIYTYHEITHPKGNSVTYDDRAFAFDFKRIPQQSQSSSSDESSSSSPNHHHKNRLFSVVTESPKSKMFSFTIKPPNNRHLKSEILSSTTVFPKSINDKIKSVSTSNGGSSDRFYQQVIPKLTTMILNSQPSVVDDEDTVVQYRSPNALMLMPQQLKGTNLKSSFSSNKPKRTPVDSSKIQILTNLQRKSTNGLNRNHNKPSSQTTSPRETYMTLSFEQSEKEEQVYPSNESGFYTHPKTIHKPSEIGKKRSGRAERRSSPSKVMSYYQQIFDSDSDSKDEPNSFKSTGISHAQTPTYFQHSGQNSARNSPSMTFSYQELSNLGPGTNLRQTESSDSSEQPFDWQQSISRYAKEFGFEVPDYGPTSSDDNNDNDGERKFSSSTNSILLSQPKSTNFLTNNDYEGSGISGIDFTGHLIPDDLFNVADTNFSPNFYTKESQDDNNGASKDEIQDLLRQFAVELQSVDMK